MSVTVEQIILSACFGGKEIYIETCKISDIRRIAEYALEKYTTGKLYDGSPSLHYVFYEDMQNVLQDWDECGDITPVALNMLMTAIRATFLDWRP